MVDKGIELAMMTATFARTAIYHAPYPREVWPNAKPFPRRRKNMWH